MKEIRYFNGRCPFGFASRAYIAAFSKASAVRLAEKAFGGKLSIAEFNQYWDECWGNQAGAVIGKPTIEGVWVGFDHKERFFKYIGTCEKGTE